uniref:Uncharacterized protein n=1 Tax=Lactuca sativa TaxID=4236 RepID=A0A9R1XVK7_LACSA|nr:hypothetical protein LSAT_V11C100037370 [Lactuca sativa]
MIVVTYQKDSRIVFDWFNFVDLFQECDDNCFFLILQTLKQYELAKLTLIEAGCCRPPCGYPAVKASYDDLTFDPISSNRDCILYKNRKPIKLYKCDSSKHNVC